MCNRYFLSNRKQCGVITKLKRDDHYQSHLVMNMPWALQLCLCSIKPWIWLISLPMGAKDTWYQSSICDCWAYSHLAFTAWNLIIELFCYQHFIDPWTVVTLHLHVHTVSALKTMTKRWIPHWSVFCVIACIYTAKDTAYHLLIDRGWWLYT